MVLCESSMVSGHMKSFLVLSFKDKNIDKWLLYNLQLKLCNMHDLNFQLLTKYLMTLCRWLANVTVLNKKMLTLTRLEDYSLSQLMMNQLCL
jgi:hypothetical protein